MHFPALPQFFQWRPQVERIPAMSGSLRGQTAGVCSSNAQMDSNATAGDGNWGETEVRDLSEVRRRSYCNNWKSQTKRSMSHVRVFAGWEDDDSQVAGFSRFQWFRGLAGTVALQSTARALIVSQVAANEQTCPLLIKHGNWKPTIDRWCSYSILIPDHI